MNEENRNFGFNPELEQQHRSKTDYLGADAPTGFADEVAGLVTAGFAWNGTKDGVYYRVANTINHCFCFFQEKLAKYFPEGQLQNKGGEKMYCVTGGFNNEMEKQLNWAYQNDKLHQPLIDFFDKYGFFNADHTKIVLSNRIPANLNGTGANGNSLKRVAQWTENNGIFPQSILEEDVPLTFNEFYDRSKITVEMINIGKESKKYLKFNYAIVNGKSNYAKYSGGIKWEIFDNYLDKDGDFIKRLAPDYNLMDYGYLVILNELLTPEDNNNNLTKNMIKTVKFETDPRVFLVSNNDEKDLLHIKDEPTWETFKMMGYVSNMTDEVIPDTDYLKYNILPQQAETPVTIFSTIVNAIVGIFKGK